MASLGTVRQQAEGLGVLKEFIDLARDPSAIVTAHETARKQLALTEAEAAKFQAAKEYIAKSDSLKTDILSRETALAAKKEAHDKTVQDFESNRVRLEKALTEKSIELTTKEKALVEIARQNEANAVALNAERKKMIDEHTRNLNLVNQKTQDNVKSHANNESIRAELERQRIALNEHAKRMKQAAEF